MVEHVGLVKKYLALVVHEGELAENLIATSREADFIWNQLTDEEQALVAELMSARTYFRSSFAARIPRINSKKPE